MAGGLIELISYGSQDLYLTGDPEITFFKVVYRRHTNFSVESIRVNFDDTVGFDCQSVLTIPKIGDLIHKIYLEVEIPEVKLSRCLDDNSDIKYKLDGALDDYKKVTNFMSINRGAYVEACEILEAKNSNSCRGVVNKINKIFNNQDNVLVIDCFRDLLINNKNAPYNYEDISLKWIISKVSKLEDCNTPIEEVFKYLEDGISKSIKLQEYFYNKVKVYRDLYEDSINENIKFAWVEKLGHAIIEEVEIRIGGDKIDRHFGDWLNIWYELTANRNLEDIYFKMIGNVDELTSFDRNAKPKYLLRVPMQFWFNRFNGLAFPLVAMEYHDITFHVKFRKFEEVSYIEKSTKIKAVSDDELFLDEVPEVLGLDLDASLLIDYIYLDEDERKRFAQSSHEYLIDQLQVLEVKDTDLPQQNIILKNFYHPSKEIIWVTQKREYVENLDGSTKLRWDNYSLTNQNSGNPISQAHIEFHSYTRVPKLDGHYFNYVQPYQHHYTTPSDGINMYSFSLFPEELQPSGSANFSRLSRVMLGFGVCYNSNERYSIRVYTRSVNILRIFSGFGSVAFHYG